MALGCFPLVRHPYACKNAQQHTIQNAGDAESQPEKRAGAEVAPISRITPYNRYKLIPTVCLRTHQHTQINNPHITLVVRENIFCRVLNK